MNRINGMDADMERWRGPDRVHPQMAQMTLV